jgi:dethiobiotin synthetase
MKRKSGIFITGTDTGVGKTYIATVIVRELKKRGINVGVMKPAETGCRCRFGVPVPADAVQLRKAAGVRDSLELVNPYRFSKPLAPSAAADMEGRSISPHSLIKAYTTLARRHEFMIVEGAGGIMVPLNDGYSFLDLAADLELPVLIIARPNLGTINHTLLTVAALRQRNLRALGVIINDARGGKNGLAEKTAPAVIQKNGAIPILACIPHGSRDIAKAVDGILAFARIQKGESIRP